MIRSFLRPSARRRAASVRSVISQPRLENLEDRLCLTVEPAIASIALTPSVVEGGTATLDVAFTDSRNLDHEAIVDWGDGMSDRLVFTSGERNFQIAHKYLDDNPSGTPFDTYTVNVTINAATIIVGDPVVFIVDISGSTSEQFAGSPVGDLNGDGDSNTILDAQIAGYVALNQSLINAGQGDISRVAVVGFDSSAFHIDVDPVTPGEQLVTTPLADKDNNGIRDVDQALMQFQYGGTTNYEAALQKAIETFTDVNAAVGHGTVVLLSDGYPNEGGSYTDEVDTLRNTWKATLYAFGVGSGASLPALQIIDPNAVIFTSTDELLDVFSGAGDGNGTGGGGTATGSETLQVVNVAPTVGLGNDQSITLGQSAGFIAAISDPGVQDTHTVAWSVTNAGGTVVAQGSGNSFSYTPNAPGTYTVKATATDDDTGVGATIGQLMVVERVAGPTIIAASRIGIHHHQSKVLIQFSESMDPVRASNFGNYTLIDSGHDQTFGTSDDSTVRLRQVRYNDADRSVSLLPVRRLKYLKPYQLIVTGTGNAGVASVQGNLLDGDSDGRAGGDAHVILKRFHHQQHYTRGMLPRPASTKVAALRATRLTR